MFTATEIGGPCSATSVAIFATWIDMRPHGTLQGGRQFLAVTMTASAEAFYTYGGLGNQYGPILT
jgi:hypothetical protein